MRLLAIVLLWPIIEISLFVTLGSWLTLWPTLAIVVGSAILGVLVLRRQGTQFLREAQRQMNRGRNPIAHLAHGMLISMAGVLLILPGFFTDALGVLLLVPPLRDGIIWLAKARIAKGAVSGVYGAGTTDAGDFRFDEGAIEGEFHEIADERPEKPGTSGWTRP